MTFEGGLVVLFSFADLFIQDTSLNVFYRPFFIFHLKLFLFFFLFFVLVFWYFSFRFFNFFLPYIMIFFQKILSFAPLKLSPTNFLKELDFLILISELENLFLRKFTFNLFNKLNGKNSSKSNNDKKK